MNRPMRQMNYKRNVCDRLEQLNQTERVIDLLIHYEPTVKQVNTEIPPGNASLAVVYPLAAGDVFQQAGAYVSLLMCQMSNAPRAYALLDLSKLMEHVTDRLIHYAQNA